MTPFDNRTIDRDQFLGRILKVNAKMSIKISEGTFAGIYSTRVEDISGDTLVIAGPVYKGALVPLAPSIEIVANAVAENGIYEFKAVVKQVISEPLYQLSLEIPAGEPVRHLQRRAFVRLEYHMPVRFQLLQEGKDQPVQGQEKQEAFCKNISGNGICLLLDFRLPRGMRMDLYLPLLEGRPPIYVMGEVVRAEFWQEGDSPPRYETGIRFVEIRLSDQDRIVKFVFDQQRRSARK